MPITTSSLGDYKEQSIVSCGNASEALQAAPNPFFVTTSSTGVPGGDEQLVSNLPTTEEQWCENGPGISMPDFAGG